MTPLLAATLAWAAGLLAGLRLVPDPRLAAGALALALLFLLVAERAGPAGPPTQTGAAGCAGGGAGRRAPARAALLAFLAAGLLVGGMRTAALRADCRSLLRDGDRVALLAAPTALPTPGAAVPVRGMLSARSGASAGLRCTGTVRVMAAPRHAPLLDSAAHGGAGLLISGRWVTYPQRGGWPRPPHYAGAVITDAVSAADDVRTTRVASFRAAQQARLRALLPGRWPLAEALLLAQKSGLAAETRARWVAAGLVHLLAISGMHVGLIVAGALAACTALGMTPRRGRRLALLLTAAYVLFLGAPTAALRALLQAGLLLLARDLQRPAEPYTLLAAAALVITVIEPLALLDPGFQLSFAGMAGLIGWRRPVADALPAALPHFARDGVAAGIAASALTTPIAALHFGQAAWVGIPGSLVAVPLLAAALCGVLIALGVAALTGSASGVHALAADLPLRLLDAVAELCARVPGGHGWVSASTVLASLALAAAAILVRARFRVVDDVPPPSHASDAEHEAYRRRARRARLRAAAAGAGVLVLLAWAPVLRPSDGRIAIHAIDVGQGDAFAIRTPRGRWVLVDAGPRTPRSDAGRDRVVPYLLKHGARRIDALILTHPDADHIGGAAAVLEAFDVGLVIDPGLAAGKDIFIDLLAAARGARQRWVAGRDGMTFDVDGVAFSLLFPIGALDTDAIANDNSVVFRLQFGSFAALFLGDAPEAVEQLLVERHGSALAAALLKVGHHGSTTSTGEALMEAVRPSIALVSAGRRNRYGHPAPAVIRRLERHGVHVLRTDRLGNITVRADRAARTEVLAR